MARLLSLPDELIENIAGYLPCSAVLNLFRVNRRLRQVCNSRRLYQQVALNGLYNIHGAVDYLRDVHPRQSRSRLDLDELSWPEGDVVLQDASLETARQFALAVDKFTSASITHDDGWTMKILMKIGYFSCSDWLPHLLALKHPAARGLEPHLFLRLQRDLDASCEGGGAYFPDGIGNPKTKTIINRWSEFTNVNFVLGFSILQRVRTTQDAKEVLEQFGRFFALSTVIFQSAPHSNTKTVQKLCELVPDYGGFGNDFFQVHAMTLIPALAIELITKFPYDSLQIKLPEPSKIPFSTFMDVPPVLCHTVKEFSICHIRKMATLEFFTGRRWVGYYSDQRNFRQRIFDPPMRNIRIVTRAPSEGREQMGNIKVIIDEQSGGVDSHGNFELEGCIYEDGSVSIEKRYVAQGWRWQWKGRLTPFGIFGVWGRHNQFGGYLWIWDEAWC